jgi:hypothetical protein
MEEGLMAAVEPGAPTAPPPAAPGRKKMLALVIVAVLIVAILGAVAVLLLSRPPVVAPVLAQVSATANPSAVDEGQGLVVSATATDSAGVDRTANTTFTWSATPASSVQIAQTPPARTAQVTATQDGSVVLTATGSWQGATRTGQVTVTVRALHYALSASKIDPFVGENVTLTVRVLDANDAPATTYLGTVGFTANDPGAFLPGAYTFVGTDAGNRSFFPVRLGRPGVVTITATDTVAGITGSVDLTGIAGILPQAAFVVETIQPSGSDILVRVNATGSNDPDGTIQTYNWTWDDGTYTETAQAVTDHTYPASYAGQEVTITLRVTDDDGLTDTVSEVVNVTLAPSADFTIARSRMHVDVDGSISSDPDNAIVTYEWDWGDGQGTLPLVIPTASHDYAVPGNYTITLTVVDATTLTGSAGKKVSVANSTLDYTYYDYFVPSYGEWWDYRTAIYGDLPIRAECFNATSIVHGVCTPADGTVADYSTYPYTNWYPLPGNIRWDNPNNVPLIYAPYRFRATGVDLSGYNASEPVFLPVLNSGAAPGTRIDFDWRMQYLDVVTMDYLTDVALCPGVGNGTQDGFKIRAQIAVTMDLQSSRRIFGVQAADATAAQAWWDANTIPSCFGRGPLEIAYSDWWVAMGGSSSTVGKYDIYNSFEWYYQPFYTQIATTVDPDGTTHVSIDTAAWGTEVVLSRMFYWGNASYANNYLDSTKAAGWWGMELAWFEDLVFTGSLDASAFNFTLSSVMQYHWQHLALPGANGFFDRTDDVPYWTWGPLLTDYTNDASARHLLSELDRYPTESYLHTTPGAGTYNVTLPYDYVPIRWDLEAGQTWHFDFPTGDVIFYDPNLSPVPANPVKNSHIPVSARLQYQGTNPLGFGDWDGAAMTWDVFGPTATGGPDGSPGNYALESWGAIRFVPEVAGAGAAAVAAAPVAETSGFSAAPAVASISVVAVPAREDSTWRTARS